MGGKESKINRSCACHGLYTNKIRSKAKPQEPGLLYQKKTVNTVLLSYYDKGYCDKSLIVTILVKIDWFRN